MRYLFLILIASLFTCTSATAQVAVIAHSSVPVDTIEKIDLLDFYTGDIRVWQDENPVVVFDLKTKNDVKKSFYRFIGKSTSRMKSIWMKKMLAGESDPPMTMASEAEMLAKVASTPGAIGFISGVLVAENVKTLIIIDVDDG
jgi:ABC-type phosphate transport system substrate-binding protein